MTWRHVRVVGFWLLITVAVSVGFRLYFKI